MTAILQDTEATWELRAAMRRYMTQTRKPKTILTPPARHLLRHPCWPRAPRASVAQRRQTIRKTRNAIEGFHLISIMGCYAHSGQSKHRRRSTVVSRCRLSFWRRLRLAASCSNCVDREKRFIRRSLRSHMRASFRASVTFFRHPMRAIIGLSVQNLLKLVHRSRQKLMTIVRRLPSKAAGGH